MGHVQKKLYSTAAKLAISPSSLSQFPPREFEKNPGVAAPFDADVWASLQPPAKSALSAFSHRIGLGNILTSDKTIQQACVHPSFLTFHQKYYPNEPLPRSNAQLAAIGNSLMGLFASEYLHASYPHLPLRVLKAAVSAHVGPMTCASVAQEMGATPLLRWHRQPATLQKPALLHTDALSSIPRAITALIYQERSLLAARKFVHSFFLSREADIRNMIKFTNPKKALMETVAKFKRERPKSRLLKETGRYSQSPIFVVGIFSGSDQLGEGFGSSLRMAEYRAAEDALHRVYLTRTPTHLLQLPSSTFPSPATISPASPFTIYERGIEGDYIPGELGENEVHYASSGRSHEELSERGSLVSEQV